MAGDWIKVRHDLPFDPAVVAISMQTNLSEDEVVGKLLRFWIWGDQQTVDGNAAGVTKAFLDRYLGVTGFADAMESAGWLEADNGGISIPKFERHISQSAKARALTAIRVAKCKAKKGNADDVSEALPREEKRKRREREEEEKKRKELQDGFPDGKPRRAAPDRSAEIRAVFDHYRLYHPKAHRSPKSGMKEWGKIRARLEEGATVEDLCSAVDGIHKIPYNLGANDQGREYLSLELIMRDSSHIAKYMEADTNPPRPVNEKERRTLDAASRFVERMTNEPA